MASEPSTTIPTVDLSPFFHEDEAGRKQATEIIHHACQTYGFFRIVNHGMSTELMAQAIKLSKAFFELPEEEKLKFRPIVGSEAPLPAGYSRQPDHSPDKNEYLLMFSSELGFNLLPADPPEFRSVLDECFTQLARIGLLVEEILNECMGLPPNFFKEYNKDRRTDFMAALRYFPATGVENNGLSEHQDGNCLTFVFQDDVGGLEVLKDGEWISADPQEGSIIVNVGDIIQVLSNNKFHSAMHRVVRRGRHRHSFAFFFNIDGEKWIEPLPQFTSKIGEAPSYRGFRYKEYLQLRLRNKTHPPSRPEDVIHISHYAISPCK
uniref:Sexual differentiation process protein isp7 n=2 Tax=Elaeis guineensis var. tenera TaxID=51953 RepID=A0A6I9S581_ELAGV|nr:sexual differentiation process protein isp7 [Elaeis guineensis]